MMTLLLLLLGQLKVDPEPNPRRFPREGKRRSHGILEVEGTVETPWSRSLAEEEEVVVELEGIL